MDRSAAALGLVVTLQLLPRGLRNWIETPVLPWRGRPRLGKAEAV